MKTVIEMAHEAGIDEWWDSGSEWRETFDAHLERFSELVRADERARMAEQPAPVQKEPVPEAMKIVIEAMRADPDYAWSWHCNIAMAFVDAEGDHYTGNQGAARFMKMLANVEPAHELPSPPAQRKPLTEEEIGAMWVTARRNSPVPHVVFARAIEAAHGIKENT